MSELLPCPFCGMDVACCSDTNELDRGGSCYMHTVVCDATKDGCGATIGYEFVQADAIAAWNRRAPVQVSEARGDDRKDAALTRAEVPAYKVGDRVIWQNVYATVFDARIIEHTFRLKLEDGCTVHASESEIIPAPPTDSRGAL